MPPLVKNEFYDINKFPKGFGICVFGISMPYITSRQSPQACFDADLHQIPMIQESGVGNVVVYSDGLYQYSNEPAATLKCKFQRLMEEHQRGYKNLIKKRVEIIPSSYTFVTWGQLLLDVEKFSDRLKLIHEYYAGDELFQEYVAQDIEQSGRSVDSSSVAYILEEVLVDFLVVKGEARLRNDYVQDRQTWILNCYHGKPHRAHVYFSQKNPMQIKLNSNRYENSWYDMVNQKLYDFDRLDIQSFDFKT